MNIVYKGVIALLMLFTSFGMLVGNNLPFEKEIPFQVFQNLTIKGSLQVFFTQSEETSIIVRAKSQKDLDEVDFEFSNQTLTLDNTVKRRGIFGCNVSTTTSARQEVHISSSILNVIGISGSGTFKAMNDVTFVNLMLSISGSGKANINGTASNTNISISGSGRVDMERFNLNNLTITISGSGRAVIAGTVNNLNISISGSGRADTINMIAKIADVNISGSGIANIFVEEVLTARVSGSGRVTYSGNPPHVTKRISGSGRVTPN